MKADYKGFEINVEREKCLGGWSMLYYTVMRKSDGYFLIDSFEDSEERVRDQVSFLKGVVDRYLIDPSEFEDIDDETVGLINQ